MSHEENYQAQRQAGRLMGDSYSSTTTRTISRPVTNKAPAPKGHEAFLKALESSGAYLVFEISSGGTISGVVKTSDKYTISIQEEHGTRVLFKHDISSFYVKAPSKTEAH